MRNEDRIYRIGVRPQSGIDVASARDIRRQTSRPQLNHKGIHNSASLPLRPWTHHESILLISEQILSGPSFSYLSFKNISRDQTTSINTMHLSRLSAVLLSATAMPWLTVGTPTVNTEDIHITQYK
jgi:hypothetical protein